MRLVVDSVSHYATFERVPLIGEKVYFKDNYLEVIDVRWKQQDETYEAHIFLQPMKELFVVSHGR